ncbi:MAG: 50S ribosomal protein L15 [Pseudomonadota bacterium]|nr:50S ribosomal protein L15 [Pseudomonadota bacterium]HJO35577.1 50S ribosomal protein L15 [Gammaproteobacteria bacterium]
MDLNGIAPAPGAHKPKKRLGRGIGSGLGKTAGRGHKGQKSRSGGRVQVGFEGGQMPMHRRVPKRGFRSAARRAEVRLSEIAKLTQPEITLEVLRAAGVVRRDEQDAKVILSGTIERAVTVRGLRVTAGARAAIEAAGGTVTD